MSIKKRSLYSCIRLLIDNTVRNHRPKLPTLVQNCYYVRVVSYITPSEITDRNHRPKSPFEICDIITKILIEKTAKLAVRNHRPNSPRRPKSPHTVRNHRPISPHTVRNHRPKSPGPKWWRSEITGSPAELMANHLIKWQLCKPCRPTYTLLL